MNDRMAVQICPTVGTAKTSGFVGGYRRLALPPIGIWPYKKNTSFS